MSKAAGTAFGFVKPVRGDELRLREADEHELCNPLAGGDSVGFCAVIDEGGFPTGVGCAITAGD